MTPLELAKKIAHVMDEKLAENLKGIRIGDLSVLADYFVLATGTSNTHVKALADEVSFKLGEEGVKPLRTEGYRSNAWILLDYGSVIVHIFTPEGRAFYDLDRLWRDGESVDLSDVTR